MSDTITAHVGPTAEELVRRARRRELREQIAKLAIFRTQVNRAYRLPHGSDAFVAALTAAGATEGFNFLPERACMRWYITELHIELAHLRGKVHCPVR